MFCFCFLFLRLVYPKLLVSLDGPFLIALSVFSHVNLMWSVLLIFVCLYLVLFIFLFVMLVFFNADYLPLFLLGLCVFVLPCK